MDAAGETTPERHTKRHLKDMKKSAELRALFLESPLQCLTEHRK